MVAALCLAALAATPNASSTDESSMPSPVEAMSIAVDAYVYGYPLVTFDTVRACSHPAMQLQSPSCSSAHCRFRGRSS